MVHINIWQRNRRSLKASTLLVSCTLIDRETPLAWIYRIDVDCQYIIHNIELYTDNQRLFYKFELGEFPIDQDEIEGGFNY